MIVWGLDFDNDKLLNTSGKYNPNTDSWTATSTTNTPSIRADHTAVWTGSEMTVWGGQTQDAVPVNTGARYNPITNSWTATSTTNAPTARYLDIAVWTGSEMIIWGGWNGSHVENTGGRYDAAGNS
jgi:N-acetylneuraminic acid mutarotase